MLEASAAEMPDVTLAPCAPRRLSFGETVDLVSQCSGIAVAEIMSGGRTHPVARARQLAMVLCYDEAGVDSGRTTTTVGRFFARDHSTVVHALQVWRSPPDDMAVLYRRCLLYRDRADDMARDLDAARAVGRFARTMDDPRRIVVPVLRAVVRKVTEQRAHWRSRIKAEVESCGQVGKFCASFGAL